MSLIYIAEPYDRTAQATVLEAGPDGIRLDRTLFYPTGGGQPGDTGWLRWDGGACAIVDTVKGAPLVTQGADILHRPAPGEGLPPPGTPVTLELDWDRRHRHMRMHTTLHLLCAVVDGAVTGGQVGADRSRLDFDVPSGSLDRQEIEDELNRLIDADYPVRRMTITDEELAARPDLVRTMSVKPPTGAGTVSLLKIGNSDSLIDLQPCGGTHVAHTGEIGPVEVVKIENKGRMNRRVVVALRE